jgi:peptidoglycan/xylan/chitin deacetylase (PgdA/CDA1 family)
MRARIVVADESEVRFYDLDRAGSGLRLARRLTDPAAHLHNRDMVSDKPGRVFDHAPPSHGRRGAVGHHSTGGEQSHTRLRARTAVVERVLKICTLSLVLALGLACGSGFAATAARVAVPILVYHRFGAAVTDSMTVTDDTFAWQLQYLEDRGYTVIPLHDLVDFLRGTGSAPPPRSVVITADDGHRSVYSDMLPLIKQYGFHVTLFIYPSAISNASYALTWPELAELIHTGLFDVQSHTYWHPNFHQDKKRLAPPQYDAFVHMQLTKSRNVLESRLGIHVDLLAWPFGIYDDDLMARAQAEGYVAALSIERRPATNGDPLMELPRYLMTNADRGPAFGELLEERVSVKERATHSTAR